MRDRIYKDVARIIITIIGAALAVLVLAWLLSGPKCEPEASAAMGHTPARIAEHARDIVEVEPWESDDWLDPMGISEFVLETSEFPSEEQLRLIGRLAVGLENWKRSQGGWWYCGEFMEARDPRLADLAVILAYNLVRSAAEVSEDPDKVEDAFILNVWGMAGTIANESRFDACALGLYPRKWAYSEGLLEPRRTCISHTLEEVLSVVNNDEAELYFKRSGFDLGFCQVLSRFYREVPPEKALSINGGMEICAREMKIRAMRHTTNRPWLFWRGSATPWYDAKIKKWARMLGATAEEI